MRSPRNNAQCEIRTEEWNTSSPIFEENWVEELIKEIKMGIG
jgi:hypothetical protein